VSDEKREKKSRKQRFSDSWIAKHRLELPQEDWFDTKQSGLILRISYGGARTFRVRYDEEDGKSRTHKLGRWHPENFNVDAARKVAKKFDPEEQIFKPRREAAVRAADEAQAAKAIGNGDLAPDAKFKDVVELFLEKRASKFRTYKEVARCLRKYTPPSLGEIPLTEITGRQVKQLRRDLVAKNGKTRQADIAVGLVRSVMRWFEKEEFKEGWVCPVKINISDDDADGTETRDRHLRPDELKLVWSAASQMGQFGALIKMLLLTGQRRQCMVTAKWSEFEGNVWTIRKDSRRQKGTAKILRLPPLAMEVLQTIPRIKQNPYLFGVEHKGEHIPFNSFSQRSEQIRQLLPPDMERWTLHDLRRTARTLMGGIKEISPHVAESVLGHKLQGVEGIYNHAEMTDMKAEALELLSHRIADFVGLPPDHGKSSPVAASNIVRLDKARRA
jgi:integrase